MQSIFLNKCSELLKFYREILADLIQLSVAALDTNGFFTESFGFLLTEATPRTVSILDDRTHLRIYNIDVLL